MPKEIHYPRDIWAFFFGVFLILSGFVRRAKYKAQSGQSITGIAFHNPSRKLFDSSIRWLKKNGYTFISSYQLADILNNKSIPPPGAVWITLDDAWKGNLENVIPAVIRHDIPVTIYVATGPVQNNGIFWWELAKKYEDKLGELYDITAHDLYCLPESKRKEIVGCLEEQIEEEHPRQAMSIDDIKTIAEIPQVTLGCHTVNHVIMSNCTNKELIGEITESKRALEKWITKEVLYFAYPNGNFDGRETAIMRNVGFKMATTIENNFIGSKDDPYLVPRFVARDDGFLVENICHMTGVWQPWINKIKDVLQGLKSCV